MTNQNNERKQYNNNLNHMTRSAYVSFTFVFSWCLVPHVCIIIIYDY